MATNKDYKKRLKQWTRAAKAQGIDVVHVNNGHIEFRFPAGHKCQVAASASDWRSVRNTRSKLKRHGMTV